MLCPPMCPVKEELFGAIVLDNAKRMEWCVMVAAKAVGEIIVWDCVCMYVCVCVCAYVCVRVCVPVCVF